MLLLFPIFIAKLSAGTKICCHRLHLRWSEPKGWLPTNFHPIFIRPRLYLALHHFKTPFCFPLFQSQKKKTMSHPLTVRLWIIFSLSWCRHSHASLVLALTSDLQESQAEVSTRVHRRWHRFPPLGGSCLTPLSLSPRRLARPMPRLALGDFSWLRPKKSLNNDVMFLVTCGADWWRLIIIIITIITIAIIVQHLPILGH